MATNLDGYVRDTARLEFADIPTVSITLDAAQDRFKPRVIWASLINLSSQGAKLALPIILPQNKEFRLRLTIDQFALQFYVSAKVCWTAVGGEDGSVIGCRFRPSLPNGLLDHLAAGGTLDRRDSPRGKVKSTIRIVRQRRPARSELANLQNFSTGGFCIETTRPATPGELFRVLPEAAENTAFDAVIRWQLQQGKRYLLGCGYVGKKGFERLEYAAHHSH
jgi:PilZ domain-containing protein